MRRRLRELSPRMRAVLLQVLEKRLMKGKSFQRKLKKLSSIGLVKNQRVTDWGKMVLEYNLPWNLEALTKKIRIQMKTAKLNRSRNGHQVQFRRCRYCGLRRGNLGKPCKVARRVLDSFVLMQHV